jgi:hypothetical protein
VWDCCYSILAVKEYEMGNWEMVSCRQRLISKIGKVRSGKRLKA